MEGSGRLWPLAQGSGFCGWFGPDTGSPRPSTWTVHSCPVCAAAPGAGEAWAACRVAGLLQTSRRSLRSSAGSDRGCGNQGLATVAKSGISGGWGVLS